MEQLALPVPVFNGENYHFWSIKMATYFKSHGLWEIIECGVCDASSKEELRKDARALFTIQQALTDDVFPRICEATSAERAWDILEEEFRGSYEARSAKLRFYQEEFDRGIRMEGLGTCQEYYSRLRLMVSRIEFYGGYVCEEDIVRKLLEGLPEEFGIIVNKMKERNLTNTSARKLIGSLEAFEIAPSLYSEGEESGSEGKRMTVY